MGSVRRRRRRGTGPDYGEGKGHLIYPHYMAEWRLAGEEVMDYEFVECEEPPDFSHGIVWAHRCDASPPDLFGELLAYIEIKLDKVQDQLEVARMRAQERYRRAREGGSA